eukprot:TRINITY_DN10373_c0_g1_i1.p1 TRINITY_DN10373_c0_g1~~TRINITY_DN10373_c0_g1_i1.p1  ORF type:complete len:773 (+),score=145.90 TRINITY_DN10373_c0_g1_i1:2487-4805(+)
MITWHIAPAKDLGCAITGSLHVIGWGAAQHGQLVDIRYQLPNPTFLHAISKLRVTQIACGSYHTLMLLTDGRVYAFGSNKCGQLGGGTETITAVVPDISDTVVSVAACAQQSAFITDVGELFCCGNNALGQFALEESGFIRTPTKVPLGVRALAIALGNTHGVVVCQSGVLMSFGNNDYAQLGRDGPPTATPVMIPPAAFVACGGYHTLVLCQDGAVYSWGANSVGQCGRQACAAIREPTQIEALADVNAIACGQAHSMALIKGTVVCWGSNAYGELGRGAAFMAQFDYQPAATLLSTKCVGIEAGPRGCFALTGAFKPPLPPPMPKIEVVTPSASAVRIIAVSWNVGGADPPSPTELAGLLAGAAQADLVVFGLQEVIGMASAGAIFGVAAGAFNTSTSAKGKWDRALANVLAAYGQFELVASKQLAGIQMCVFARPEVTRCFQRVSVSQIGVGLAGVMGNKGAVAVRMDMASRSICFVNCHLAAGDGEKHANRRAQDVRDINSRLVFEGLPLSIESHDVILWMGDLNTRVAMGRAATDALMEQGGWRMLLHADELRLMQASGDLLPDFSEAPLTFEPTYKFAKDGKTYDANRTPSWCDRIVWRTRAMTSMQCLKYHSEFTQTSDHRAVIADLALTVSSVLPFQRASHESISSYGYTATSTIVGAQSDALAGKRPPPAPPQRRAPSPPPLIDLTDPVPLTAPSSAPAMLPTSAHTTSAPTVTVPHVPSIAAAYLNSIAPKSPQQRQSAPASLHRTPPRPALPPPRGSRDSM